MFIKITIMSCFNCHTCEVFPLEMLYLINNLKKTHYNCWIHSYTGFAQTSYKDILILYKKSFFVSCEIFHVEFLNQMYFVQGI